MKKLVEKFKNFFRKRKTKRMPDSTPENKVVFLGDGSMKLLKYDGRYYIFDSTLGEYASKWIT